ncbi:MAG TPA: fumarylacetoacetate hydrolase family protein [Candidatus Limnocylindria bacterium]|nr:fumarylacetoacetate hydrolase family protein [Candidatus Limnocylindria bacterium]
MRIASYRAGSEISWGVVRGDDVSDARSVAGAPRSVRELLESGDQSRLLRSLSDPAARGFGLGDVQLLAPLEPRQDLIALGLNYVQHADETTGATKQAAPPKQPIVFGKAATSVIGPDAEIRFDRSVTSQVDWEVELAVVIGRRGRDVRLDAAIDHVFGYTVANDVSARDLQFLDGGQWYRGKSLDTFCPLGPWIATRDELGDATGLRLTTRVNGVTKQDATTDELIFGIAETIASVSAGRTLYPGDVILTGTPGGVGFTRKAPEFLRDGDVVEVEIERIGALRNRVREISTARD